VAYSYAYYALNPEFNWLYPAYIAIVAMGLYGCLYLLLAIDAHALERRIGPDAPIRAASALLMLLPVGLGLAWLTMILTDLATGQMPTRVNQVVWPMDLIILFPAMFWGGLWLWRHQPLGYLVAPVLLVKAGLLGITLVVDSWLATAYWHAPLDSAVTIYGLGGTAGLLLAARYLRSVGLHVAATPWSR
jgi:hypothetical protein